jgi:hypothetical protein
MGKHVLEDEPHGFSGAFRRQNFQRFGGILPQLKTFLGQRLSFLFRSGMDDEMFRPEGGGGMGRGDQFNQGAPPFFPVRGGNVQIEAEWGMKGKDRQTMIFNAPGGGIHLLGIIIIQMFRIRTYFQERDTASGDIRQHLKYALAVKTAG